MLEQLEQLGQAVRPCACMVKHADSGMRTSQSEWRMPSTAISTPMAIFLLCGVKAETPAFSKVDAVAPTPNS